MSRDPYDPQIDLVNQAERCADALERIAESYQPLVFAAGQLTGMLHRLQLLYPDAFHPEPTTGPTNESAANQDSESST